jgi:nitrous oxidase accessory protein NosD
MKPIALLICCLLLLAPFNQAQASGGTPPGKVILTPDMVHSAPDIEAAILQATEDGTRPGLVILDGRQGPFEYDQDALDVDVNIWVSNLILRGVHRAVLNGGAINLDGMFLENITIEGLKMDCPNDCITSPDGLHQNVIVRDNRLQAGNFGIDVGGSESWWIKNNRIVAGQSAIHLVSTIGIKVQKNHLQGYIPVMLGPADECQILNNTIAGEWQGILLSSDSQANRVLANSISGVQASGITLGPETWANEVHRNWVSCAEDAPGCLVVEDLGTDNHTGGNQP